MDFKQASDIELWQCCRHDNIQAYNELFSRYYPRMFQLASRYIHDTMVAEELCMDQLFRLWMKREEIIIKSDFSSYLFRAIRNLVISHLRKNIPVALTLEELREDHQADSDADYQLLSEEAQQVYRNALSGLSPQRRQVFILSREEHLTYAEIAQRMGLSVNTVENYMVAALSILRKKMKEYAPPALIPLLLFSHFPSHLL
ncbi:RNA polymerase sigma-70 factor [Chitinophaga sp. 212800010-3]|uniref:RNA polymerase sigma-70 factor n=1 Tax=unclassified Chitinophaga TaxID=2619133 RepID=UPI002E0FCA44